MKRIISSLFCLSLLFASVTSCDLFKVDNYGYPNADLKGSIIDVDTRETIQTDIVNGASLSLTQLGFDVEIPQTLVIKNDGTYENALLFAGEYKIEPLNRNFYPVDAKQFTMKEGENTVNFEVVPFVRIKDLKIEKSGKVVTATFKLEAPNGDAINTVSLYESTQSTVGASLYDSLVSLEINKVPAVDEVFTLQYDCSANSQYIKENKDYFFRVGALSSVDGAKPNYAPAQRMNIGTF